MRIQLHNMGLATRHLPGEKRTISEGTPSFVFMQMLTPGIISTESGVQHTEPFDCIFYLPHTPRVLYSSDENVGFQNNWVFFDGEGIEEMLNKYGLSPNHVYHPDAVSGVSECFSLLFGEHIRPEGEDTEMESLLMQQMMIYLSRGNHTSPISSSGTTRQYDRLSALRFDIYRDVTREWSVDGIAKQLGMSTTWLNVLYHERYGLSLKQDIIQARIEYSKQLMIYSDRPLREIAVLSGFQNEYYFSRVFHKHAGTPPGSYRKSRTK